MLPNSPVASTLLLEMAPMTVFAGTGGSGSNAPVASKAVGGGGGNFVAVHGSSVFAGMVNTNEVAHFGHFGVKRPAFGVFTLIV